ncbi:hypothetical protein ACFLV1_01870 [Chloroflexota bacterium]
MVITDTKVSKESTVTCKLKAADILLIHTKRSLWGWIIRCGTRCYWNHALIVCSAGNQEQSYSDTLIVDPKTDGSIEMDCINKYFGRLNKYDVAVKRLEAEWFQDDGKSGEIDFRSRICNVAANEAAAKLGSKLIQLINRTIRQIKVIYRFVRRKIKASKAPLHLPWNIKPIQMKAFTCSGFVQWCYYKGVSQIVKERGVDRARLREVIFKSRTKKKVTPFELLTTTPADIANFANLSWKYVIKDGVIREVSSGEEAKLITVRGIRH